MAYDWLNYCNKKNLKEKGSYGVRVARPGFDANTCADNQLIFNSGWPILQLCAVLDFDKAPVTYTRYLLPNGTWSDTLPSGYRLDSTTTDDSRWGKFGVNRNYCRMYVNTKTYFNDNYDIVEGITYKRMTHRLGWTPFFIPADSVSGMTSNKVLLFSVDIETDVDYPYTEAALPMFTVPDDYGMKCESIFGDRVPGLSTGQFSKLVQAVKTQETAKYNIRSTTGEGDGYYSFWSPLESAPSTNPSVSPVEPYEAFSFAITGETNYNNNNAIYDDKDGGYYVEVGIMWLSDSNSQKPYVYSNISQSPANFKKESLVILRSPLVSPEITEVSV